MNCYWLQLTERVTGYQVQCCRHSNTELCSIFNQRLQGVEVWQERRHPRAKPQVAGATHRSAERLNLHPGCGQQPWTENSQEKANVRIR